MYKVRKKSRVRQETQMPWPIYTPYTPVSLRKQRYVKRDCKVMTEINLGTAVNPSLFWHM